MQFIALTTSKSSIFGDRCEVGRLVGNAAPVCPKVTIRKRFGRTPLGGGRALIHQTRFSYHVPG
jgi:hypothetical protein